VAGAGLFALWGGAVVALVDAATFVASAATLVALRFVEPPPAPREHRFFREISAGFGHIWRTLPLRQLTVGLGVAMLVVGFSETLIFAVTANGLHRSPAFIGVLEVFQGIGSVAGGVTAARLLRRIGDVRLTGLGLAVFAVGDAFLLVPRMATVLAGAVLAGVGIVWAVVALATAYQQRSPQSVQGRVNAAANMLFSVPQTISIAVGAALITVVDYRVEIVAMGAVVLVAAAYLLTRREAEPVEIAERLAA
jgi:Na+/melibiose symporter-like transporter